MIPDLDPPNPRSQADRTEKNKWVQLMVCANQISFVAERMRQTAIEVAQALASGQKQHAVQLWDRASRLHTQMNTEFVSAAILFSRKDSPSE